MKERMRAKDTHTHTKQFTVRVVVFCSARTPIDRETHTLSLLQQKQKQREAVLVSLIERVGECLRKVWMGEAREIQEASGPGQPSSIDRQGRGEGPVAKKSVVVVVLGLGIILFAFSE